MKVQIQLIVERTAMRLAEMPSLQAPALLSPRDPAERARENERRSAARAAREHVATEAVAAIKAEIPGHWPKWNSAGWDSAESEFEAIAAWLDKMAKLDRPHRRAGVS